MLRLSVPTLGPLKARVKVSVDSRVASSSKATVTVLFVSPAAKESVPFVAM